MDYSRYDPFTADPFITWEIVNQSGHFPHIENPILFQKIIVRWIKNNE